MRRYLWLDGILHMAGTVQYGFFHRHSSVSVISVGIKFVLFVAEMIAAISSASFITLALLDRQF